MSGLRLQFIRASDLLNLRIFLTGFTEYLKFPDGILNLTKAMDTYGLPSGQPIQVLNPVNPVKKRF
jgi:hypothetical protein